jgi:hypothetical protein
MVHDGDGGAGGAGGNDKRLTYMRFLVLTTGGPFRPQDMPSMSIKTAEGFGDGFNCFCTFFITSVAKRVPQVRIAIKSYNLKSEKKIDLLRGVDGLDCVVIFPGKTNYKDNKFYKKISEAKAAGSATYWVWSSTYLNVPIPEIEVVVSQPADDKTVCEELEDELAMVKAENKEAYENLEAELAKVKSDNKRVRDELEAELVIVREKLALADEENQRLRGELEESQNIHGGLKQMRFCCG